MKIYNDLLNDLNSFINKSTLKYKYHEPLPPELDKWYVYTLDGGHCVFVLLHQDESEMKNDPDSSYLDYLLPCWIFR
jgi:hypothetical protein